MPRVPLLSGSRVPLVALDDDALLLTPPPPLDPLGDIAAAVGEALRYPLSGPGLAGRVAAGARATVVVEPRVTAAARRSERPAAGRPRRRARRARPPRRARRPADDPDRRRPRAPRRTARARVDPPPHAGARLPRHGRRARRDGSGAAGARAARAQPPVRIHEALLDTDLIVSVTAAETSERGGAGVLLDACAAADIARPAPAPSLLAPSLSPTGILAGKVAAALAERCAVTGVSIVLDHPRLTGRFRGYPSSAAGIETVARSPGAARRERPARGGAKPRASAPGARAEGGGNPRRAARRLARRGAAARASRCAASARRRHSTRSSCRCRGCRCTSRGSRSTRSRPPPSASATPCGSGATPRRCARAGRSSCCTISGARFGHGSQAPYRTLFHVLREGAERRGHRGRAAGGGDRTPARSPPTAAATRRTRSCPTSTGRRAARCSPGRGACSSPAAATRTAARALGLVPTHNISAALEMARGVAGGSHRVGVLVAPPYAPLVVG